MSFKPFYGGMHIPLSPSFLGEKSQYCMSSNPAELCWVLRATLLFTQGQCTKVPGHLAQVPLLFILKKCLGCVPHFTPADVIQLLRTALFSEICAFCWKLHHLLRSTQASEICTICWVPCHLLRDELGFLCCTHCQEPPMPPLCS